MDDQADITKSTQLFTYTWIWTHKSDPMPRLIHVGPARYLESLFSSRIPVETLLSVLSRPIYLSILLFHTFYRTCKYWPICGPHLGFFNDPRCSILELQGGNKDSLLSDRFYLYPTYHLPGHRIERYVNDTQFYDRYSPSVLLRMKTVKYVAVFVLSYSWCSRSA